VSLLEVERGAVRARYLPTFVSAPESYSRANGDTLEYFLQLEPNGKLYAVTPEHFRVSPDPGTAPSQYWIDPF
jgi:hypothetical protein